MNPRFDTSKNLAEIRALSRADKEKYISTDHEVPVGLTASGLKLDANYHIQVKSTSGNPMVCAQISSFDLIFGFEDIVVFLARELPRPSCSYDVVLGHEMQHVAVDQKLVQAYTSYFPSLLQQAVERIGVIRAGSAAEAERRIKRDIGIYIKDFGATLSTEREKRQRRIDTPAEYKRLGQSCNGALGKLIGGRSR